MTNLPFEASGKWSVKHGQDFMADLVNTRNIDMGQPGFITLAKKPVVIFNEDTDTDFGTVMAIVPISSGASTIYYVVTTEHVFQWTGGITAPNEVTFGGTPTLGVWTDAVAIGTFVLVSGTTTAKYYDPLGAVWEPAVTGLSASYPHPMCLIEHLPGAPVAIGDGNIVHQYETVTYVEDTANKLTLPSNYVVTGLRWRAGNVYVATRDITGNSAKMFVWNGTGTTAQTAWDVKSDWIYSLIDYDASMTVLTSAGRLLRFNGGGFDPIAEFPVYNTPYSWNSPSAISSMIGKCTNRGMVAHGDTLYINVEGVLNTIGLADAPSRYLPTQPSGLWAFEPGIGLYHKAGYCYTKYNSTTFTFGSSNLVFAAAHNLQTGDPVYMTNVTGLTGVNANQLYYAIVVSSTSIKLAFTSADALAGNYVTIMGVPSGATAIIDTFTSVGASYSTAPGAVALFVSSNPPSILGLEVMFAGDVTKADGSQISSFMSLGMGHNVGSFTTTPIPASQVTDTFQKLFQFVSNVYLQDAKIVVKYRTTDRFGLPNSYRRDGTNGVATWVTSSSFTVDTLYKDMATVIVGDEISIIEGAGAGYTGHITAISKPSTTWTVTIDETIPGITAGNVSEVIAENWKKLLPIVSNTPGLDQEFSESSVGNAAGSYVQFKVELRGIGLGIRKMQSINAKHKESA